MNNTTPKIALLSTSTLIGHVKIQTHSNKTECSFPGNFVKYLCSYSCSFHSEKFCLVK